jgi:hypothetical protein
MRAAWHRQALLGAALVMVFSAQRPPSVSENHGAFGFPNPAGTEFIVRHDVPNPERLRSSLCAGDVRPIVFDRRQNDAGADRDNPGQFASLAGTVFRAVKGGADSNDACLLAPDSLLAGANVLRTRPGPASACAAAHERWLAGLRQRQIRRCWSLGAVQPRGSISAVEYVRLDADALASIIVELDGRPVTIDLQARFTRAGEDLWRVDDGGDFGADGISVPFLIRRGMTLLIPLRWNGAENVAVSLWITDDTGPKTRQVLADAWYRAPRSRAGAR